MTSKHLNSLGFKCTLSPPKPHTHNSQCASLSPSVCQYAFAESCNSGYVKLHTECAEVHSGAPFLCESLTAGWKCCCHAHPPTPLSTCPHQWSSIPPFILLANSSYLSDALPRLLHASPLHRSHLHHHSLPGGYCVELHLQLTQVFLCQL